MKITFNILKIIKIIAAIILIFSIFLPFSSCTKTFVDASQIKNIPPTDRPPKMIKHYFDENLNKMVEKECYQIKTSRYVLRDFEVDEITNWLLVLCFIWPFILFAFSKIIKSNKSKIINWIIEPIASVLAAIFIFHEGWLAADTGALVSFFSNFTMLIIWLIEIALVLYLKIKYKNLQNACLESNATLPFHRGW